MESLTFRRATLSDKNDVLNINTNIYDGQDYLCSYYDEFIENPNITPYVAMINGHVVGFEATYVVDGGLTVITRAARVREDLAGKGIFNKLNRHVLGESGQKIHVQSCTSCNPGTQRESFKLAHREILKKPMFEIKPCSIGALNLQKSTASSLKMPTDEDFQLFFSDNNIKQYLFPRDRITVNWLPYRLLSENIPLLRIDGDRVCMYSDVSVDENVSASGLLSISTTYACMQRSHVSMLDIYGTDTATLRDHIISHIQYIKQYTKGDYLDVIVFVEPEFNVGELNQVFGDIGLNCVDPYRMQKIYEKDL